MDESHLRYVWIVFYPKTKRTKSQYILYKGLEKLTRVKSQDSCLSHTPLYTELQVHICRALSN